MVVGRRRALLGVLLGLAAPAAPAVAQPAPWWEDRRRRRSYEQWRAAEWHRRQREAHRTRRDWRRDSWQEQQEREAWARRQGW